MLIVKKIQIVQIDTGLKVKAPSPTVFQSYLPKAAITVTILTFAFCYFLHIVKHTNMYMCTYTFTYVHIFDYMECSFIWQMFNAHLLCAKLTCRHREHRIESNQNSFFKEATFYYINITY